MAYNRFWFDHDIFGLTLGGGAIKNPGPLPGAATAHQRRDGAPPALPYFTESPGDPFQAWDMQITGDYMPNRIITFRLEFTHRWANVPYWAGGGGVTPPGGNTGSPGSNPGTGWSPDLVMSENRMTAAMLIRL